MLWATILLSVAVPQIATDSDQYAAYRRCLRQASINYPEEPDTPTVVEFAKFIQLCSYERKNLLDGLIKSHLAIDDIYGKSKAYRELEGFEIDTVRSWSNRAHELPIADDRGIL
ncbi:hypothetical protein [Novosphingobium resinovorum]|uniref:hypothetical protein n=1 Tax=Novosphingobium resinovorum TaxID=158500 RepID=UPI0012EABE7C|nr:hypothetical protein [Novosphingobium resinovorum]